MEDASERPLVITLTLDDVSRSRFEAQRRALFPAGRTQVGAHLTLFHALPGALRPEVEQVLADVAATTPVLELEVGEPRSLGRGVAYPVSSGRLAALHEALRRRWLAHLTRQDAQPLRAHVTVQNKVDPDVARLTLARLRQEHEPARARGLGLELHRYDGGPWTSMGTFAFSG